VNEAESETRRVVDALYAAFLSGDGEGMLAQMSEDVEVRFLGQAMLHGQSEVRRFMEFSADLLRDLDFRIRRTIIDGDTAAVIWDESATTAAGKPWENHGVDVIRIRSGKIASLHENNDVNMVYEHFPRFDSRAKTGDEE
jgi:ketosteroid isomerase-like protein